VLVALGIVLVLVGILALRHHNQQVAAKREQTRKAVVAAKILDTRDDNDSKIAYYVNLAGAYGQNGEYQKALDSLLAADKLITDRSVNGNSMNIPIAEMYTQLGNKEKAKEYYDREIKRIQGTNNDETIRNLRALEDQL
jgi:tetratricopeptide (TPR) repeat protein